MLNKVTTSWRSQSQQTVAQLTAEVEYMALNSAVKEALFIRQLMKCMMQCQKESTIMYEDNQACIALTKNTMTNERSKHIDIKYHFCREC